MSKLEQIETSTEAQRQEMPDYSGVLPVTISKLCALAQLMFGWIETRGAVELNHEEISGIGELLIGIADDLKEINHGLYGD